MRNRSSAIAITSNTKHRMTQEIGLDSFTNEESKREKLTNYFQEKFKSTKFTKKATAKTDFFLDFPPPQYQDTKKEYYTKNEKVNNF